MLSKASVLFSILLVLTATDRAAGGQDTYTGDEQGLWDDGWISVIVAEIVKVEGQRGEDFDAVATIVPLATLSGTFDAGLHERIEVGVWLGTPGSSVKDRPRAGTTAIIVVGKREKWGYVIDPAYCKFMPDEGSSVAVIDGLGDPEVGVTLKKIQVARARGVARGAGRKRGVAREWAERAAAAEEPAAGAEREAKQAAEAKPDAGSEPEAPAPAGDPDGAHDK